MTPDVFTEGRSGEQGRGSTVYGGLQKGSADLFTKKDVTISKIRVGADHRGGVAIPDWTNHSHSHTQEAAVLVNSTK